MSGPRNKSGYEQGQFHRAEIRRVMVDHAKRYPLESITAKAIRHELPWLPITDNGIRVHMRAVRWEARLGDVTGADTLPPREFIT